MKIRIRRMLSLLLMLGLFATLLCAGAFAVDVPEISCELGTPLDYPIPLEGGGSATGFEVQEGNLPKGLEIKLIDGTVKLVGTPAASGNYEYRLNITTSEGTSEYHLIIKVAPPETTPTTEPDPTPTPTPTPTPSPTPVPEIVITKDPTGETVMEGGYAIFIARAAMKCPNSWATIRIASSRMAIIIYTVCNVSFCSGQCSVVSGQ